MKPEGSYGLLRQTSRRKEGAGTVAGISMKDGEKLSDVFFVWPEDVKKAAEAGNEEPPAGEQRRKE